MYLLYAAVVRVVPLLSDCVADVGGVVSAHGVAKVHHHCVQSVPALTLEQDAYLLVSYDKKKPKRKDDLQDRASPVWQSVARTPLSQSERSQRSPGRWPCSRAFGCRGGCFETFSSSCTGFEAGRALWRPEEDKRRRLTADRSHLACVMNSAAPDWTESLFRSLDKSSSRCRAAPGAGRRTSGSLPGMEETLDER